MSARKKRRRGRFRPTLVPLTEAEIKKQIRLTLKPRYSVECYYRDFDRTKDVQLARLTRRRISSSGFSFPTQLREVSFDGFVSEAKALACARRIKENFPDVRVMLRSLKAVE